MTTDILVGLVFLFMGIAILFIVNDAYVPAHVPKELPPGPDYHYIALLEFELMGDIEVGIIRDTNHPLFSSEINQQRLDRWILFREWEDGGLTNG